MMVDDMVDLVCIVSVCEDGVHLVSLDTCEQDLMDVVHTLNRSSNIYYCGLLCICLCEYSPATATDCDECKLVTPDHSHKDRFPLKTVLTIRVYKISKSLPINSIRLLGYFYASSIVLLRLTWWQLHIPLPGLHIVDDDHAHCLL